MKYVIINSVYKWGSTGSMLEGLFKFLNNGDDVALAVYGRGKSTQEKNVVKIDSTIEVYVHAFLSRLTGLEGSFSNHATNRLIHLLENFQPDAVILLNIHGYYLNECRLLKYLKDKNIRVVYIMPDEYPFLGACCYSKECTEYIRQCSECNSKQQYPQSWFLSQGHRKFKQKMKIYENFNNIVFVAPEFNLEKAKQSTLLKTKKLVKIDWGIDLNNTFYPRNMIECRKKYHLPIDKRIVLAVAPFTDERKGVKQYFFSCAIKSQCDDLLFVNVGYNGKQKYLPNNFIPIPYVNDQVELAEIYSCADAFVIMSSSDTMPLACLMALACGVPIVSFDISGLPLIYEKYGISVPVGDIQKLQYVLEHICRKTISIEDEIRGYAESRYSNLNFYKKIKQLASQ